MIRSSKLRRAVVAAFALSLSAAACGDDTEPVTTGDDVEEPGTDDVEPESEDGVAAEPPATEVGAVLVIGDERFEFPERNSCISNPFGMNANFSNGPDVRLEVELPPHDWETDTTSTWSPPEIGLTDRSGEGRRSYRASVGIGERHPGTDADQAVIAEYQLGDGWATGSGHVIDGQALVDAEADGTEPPPLLPLTFEIVCSL